MRGEDAFDYMRVGDAVGSPPHARGRLVDSLKKLPFSGITPACAGKTELGCSPGSS